VLANSARKRDEMEIGTEEEGQRVTLTFRTDTGETLGVSLTRGQVGVTVARLVQEIGSGSVAPIARGLLQIGASFSVQGFQVQRKTDGARLLTLAVDMPEEGRVVTIPLELSPIEVEELIKMLGTTLAQDN
jgi:hypothetical protein